jgi:hypothetical protein
VTDGIIRNNYTLVDRTGRKTRWGIWSPELINHDPFYAGLRPLNSLDILILSDGRRADHGRPKVRRGRRRPDQGSSLLIEWPAGAQRRGANWRDINHSDDELLYLAYDSLLTLEMDPARRRLLVQSMARTWEGADGEVPIPHERNPSYNFIYGATTGGRSDVEEARATLRDWPLGPRRVDDKEHASPRRLDPGCGGRPSPDHPARSSALPGGAHPGPWNANPWNADWGGDGRREDDGVAWLVDYWLGVYHGFLAPDE